MINQTEALGKALKLMNGTISQSFWTTWILLNTMISINYSALFVNIRVVSKLLRQRNTEDAKY